MANNQHPVWDVYDQLRTVRLNELYYGERLNKFERINFWSEIIVALTSSSSAIAGLSLWNSPDWSNYWKVLLIISAIIATAKPLLNLTKKIRAYEELLSGYRLLCHDLKELKIDINQNENYSVQHKKKFNKIIEKQRILTDKSPESTENKKVKLICQKRVLMELPSNNFYIPEN